jgi:hypothetical protein
MPYAPEGETGVKNRLNYRYVYIYIRIYIYTYIYIYVYVYVANSAHYSVGSCWNSETNVTSYSMVDI